ncbi:G-type lectin S-receptor-like serine/threonine-protein kinase At2g19130 isoform X1 [Carex rostrata]
MTLFILTIIIFIMGSRLCTANDTLLPGQPLSGYQTLVSKNGIYELGLFADYVGYNYYDHYKLGIRIVNHSNNLLWVANGGNLISHPLTSELHIVSTGNLVLTQSQKLIWSTNLTRSDETTSSMAVLLDTGNLVLKEEDNISRTVWQSFHHPTATWFQGAPLGFNTATGQNVYLTQTKLWWEAMNYHLSIEFSLELDPSRARGFIIRKLSSNATYHGIFPQLIDIVDDGNGLVTFNVPNKNHTFIQLDSNGIVSMYWVNGPPNFNTLWFSPDPRCNFDLVCGPSSFCLDGGPDARTCSCPDYFHPTNPEAWWGYGNYGDGCSRNISLNCQIKRRSSFDDVFLPIENIDKYPDNPQLLVLKDENECAAACLSNCSCTAYSYQNNCSLWFDELKNTSLSDYGNGYKMNIRLQIAAPKHSHRAHRFIIMSAIVVAALLVVGLLLSWKHKAICLIFNQKDITGDQLVAYSYAETKSITKNFFHKLGEGGFGSVFKGSLPNSTVVAVKRMKNVCFEEKQFRTEVQTIGIIQHINLIKLLGFCSKGTKRLLVYEYMPNGSLDSHLFSNQCDVLNWNIRYEIMVGIARGLTYLHEECRDCIIHCDIKPENILLNANLCPKIADFGMAKLLGRDFSRALTTMRGTIGYLGPEWICGQPITKKADVYSFGMMLFEIISGKRNTEKFQNPECTYFPLYAAMKTRQGEIVCLLDDRLQGNADMVQLNIACKVACWCIQEMESDRPSMRQVVQMLEGVVEVLKPPIPSFLQRLVDLENDYSMYSVVG